MTSEQAISIAKVIVDAIYAEAEFMWQATGEAQTAYRNLVRSLALAKSDQIVDPYFKIFLVTMQPLFKDAEQSRRDFVANYYSDPDTIKAMAEATKKMGKLLEEE